MTSTEENLESLSNKSFEINDHDENPETLGTSQKKDKKPQINPKLEVHKTLKPSFLILINLKLENYRNLINPQKLRQY